MNKYTRLQPTIGNVKTYAADGTVRNNTYNQPRHFRQDKKTEYVLCLFPTGRRTGNISHLQYVRRDKVEPAKHNQA